MSSTVQWLVEMSTKFQWRFLFIAGVLSPLAAVAIKPLEFGFYMFSPATPGSILDRTRLFVADSILVIGFLICALVSVRAVFVAIKKRKPYYLLIPVVIFFHPLLQPVFLERADTVLNRRWGSKARELQVVGRSEKEVRSLLGSPTHVTEDSG
jgi:hypothetical protein